MNHGYFVRFDKWFKSPHFLCGIKSLNLLPDIVFSNVMHGWVGSNRIVEVILSVAKCCTLLIINYLIGGKFIVE